MALPQILSIENLGLLAEVNLGLLFMEVLLFVTSLFLMLLILVQRGKGGGLTGALGGAGGQSAFGSKAGDAFTKITVITAMIWIMLCMVTIAAFNPPPIPKAAVNDDAEITSGVGLDEEAPGASGDADPGTVGDEPADPEVEIDEVDIGLGGPEGGEAGSETENKDAANEGADPAGDGN